MRKATFVLCAALAAVLWVHAASRAGDLEVGCDANFTPFSFKGPDGIYTGFDVQLWDAVARRMGIAYRLVPMDFNRLIPALKQGSLAAAVAGITVTADREKEIDFAFPYFNAGLLIMVRADQKGIDGIGDLDDKTVVTKTGTTSDAFAHNIQTRGVQLVPDIGEAYARLLSGKADALIFDSPALLHYLADGNQHAVKVVGPLYHRSVYGFAFPQGSGLREKVSVALLELMENGDYSRIYRQWFGTFPF